MVAQHPASPSGRRLRQPSWLDPRLIVGVLLVLVSMLLGAKVVATADRSVQVWALARDVSAGTTLAADDLRPARVRLFDSAAAYLQVVQSPAGRTVVRALRAGELLPRSAVVPTPPGAIVSIPVEPGNAPELSRGDLVDVWSTVKGCGPLQVLSRVPVQDVRAGGGALSANPASTQVIVRVSPEEARSIVAALGRDSTIRLVVLDGDLPPARARTSPTQRCDTTEVAGSTMQTSVGAAAPTAGTSAGPGSPGPGDPAAPSPTASPTGWSR